VEGRRKTAGVAAMSRWYAEEKLICGGRQGQNKTEVKGKDSPESVGRGRPKQTGRLGRVKEMEKEQK
jgi:hypothetical protein